MALEIRGKRERFYRGGKVAERSPVSWTKYLHAEILIAWSGDWSKESGALTPDLGTKLAGVLAGCFQLTPCACPLRLAARTMELINKLPCLWLLIE